MHQTIDHVLNNLKETNLLRQLKIASPGSDCSVTVKGKRYINFASNNYLGLTDHPEVTAAAIQAISEYGTGTGASRLISGTTPIHQQLEEQLARFKSADAALVFPTGYMANLGAISALAGKEDAVVIDRLNHASIIDGARLSKAKVLVFPHKDTIALKNILEKYRSKYRHVLIVTDTLFSMDGDIAPLPEIVNLAEHYKCTTMVDEAHAVGVFGKNGEGLIEHFGLSGKIDVTVGTLSKAVGSMGGYVAGSRNLIEYLVNKCRGFIYTTALPADCCAAAMKAIEIIQSDPERRNRLWQNIEIFKGLAEKTLTDKGYKYCESQIIPVFKKTPESTMETAAGLFESGYFVSAIRPPTVPKGSSRLRISLSSEHKREDIEGLVAVLTREV
ncbi:8-amino-7-oxononanoate synthase [Candidatus Margulisiibacteriota bacterium]